MRIDIFKEKINHLEGYCTMDDINEIRVYRNYKIIEAKKRATDNLNISSIEERGEFISMTLLFSKIKKTHTHDTKIMNAFYNYLDT